VCRGAPRDIRTVATRLKGAYAKGGQRSTPVPSIAILAAERCGFFNLFQAEEAIDRAAACDGR